MDPILIIIMGGISAAMVFYSLLPQREDKRRRTLQRLKPQSGPSSKQIVKSSKPQSKSAKSLLLKVAPSLSKAAMPKSEEARSNLRVKLANAGWRGRQTAAIFLASKSILGIVCSVAALAGALAFRLSPRDILGVTVFAGAVGLMLPNLWLALAIKSRKEKIAHGMPDSLDLMVVTIEAGLVIDAALKRVSEEMKSVHPELAEEFVLTSMETQMGLARSEALKNLATRTDVAEMKSLTAILIQAERFGTSIAQTVRTHADSMRVKRSQQAEERAAKTAVKLIIPLIMFIFPALFVVLAGPAMMKLFETLTSIAGDL